MLTEEQYVELFQTTWEMKIVKTDEGYEADGFYVIPEQVDKERKSITGTVIEQITEWVVYGVKTIHATFWEPEDHEEFELSRETNLGNAFMKVKLVQLEDAMGNSVTDLACSIAEQEYGEAMS